MKCNLLSKTYECTCLLCCSWIGHSDCVGNLWTYLKTRFDTDASNSMKQPLSRKSVFEKSASVQNPTISTSEMNTETETCAENTDTTEARETTDNTGLETQERQEIEAMPGNSTSHTSYGLESVDGLSNPGK